MSNEHLLALLRECVEMVEQEARFLDQFEGTYSLSKKNWDLAKRVREAIAKEEKFRG